METNADVTQAFCYAEFCGRIKILNKISDIFESVRTSSGRSIINLYGIGGIGKTSILQYVKYDLEDNGIPSASVDFRYNSLDVFDIICSLHNSLMDASIYSAVAFVEYDSVQKGMKKVEEKLLKQLKKQNGSAVSALFSNSVSESMISAGDVAGQAVGGMIVPATTNVALSEILTAAGGVVGTGIGALAGAGLGLAISKIVEHRSQDCITALNKVGLKRSEIQTFLHYKERLVAAFIKGVNKLAERDSLILGFDTFEKVPIHISQWLRRDLIPSLNNKIIVFICGREKIMNEMIWNDISNIINTIHVNPFSTAEAEEYLLKKNIHDKARIDWIVKITGCLPWALALVVDFIGDSETFSETESFETFDEDKIGEQVVMRFLDHIDDENLKTAIYVCASANYFTLDILLSYFSNLDNSDIVVEMYRKICDFSFTRKLERNKYAIHDVVSDFLLKGLKRFNMVEYKKQRVFFCDYYKKIIDTSLDVIEKAKSQWEYIYHYIKSDEIAALDLIDKFLVDADPNIPLDVFEEYLYSGLKEIEFSTNIGKLYYDFSTAQIYYITGNWMQAIELLEKILYDARTYSRFVLIECGSLTLAEIYLGQGHYVKVKNLLEHLMTQMRALSLRKKKKVSSKLNEVYAILGQYSKGEKLALESKNESENEHDPIGKAWAFKSLGDIYRLWGKPEKSIDALNEGLTIFINEQDAFGEAIVRTQLARDFIHIGKWKQAETELEKSETIYEQYGFKYGIANVWLFRGNILRLRQQWSEALSFYQKALDMHIIMQSWREISPIWGSMGLVHYHLGNNEEANEFLEKSINLKQKQGYIRGVMISRMYVGDCFFMDKKWDVALASYIAARSAIKKSAKPIYVCDELDIKIFLCRLAKKEFNDDEINKGYFSIKKQIVAHNYNHLVSLLEYFFCELQEDLSYELFSSHTNVCIEFAQKYNIFLKEHYCIKLKRLINKRFSGTDKEALEKIVQKHLIEIDGL